MSTELRELQESARRVLGEQGLAADEARTWPLTLELGWLLVAVPEELGGLGQGLAGACAFHTEMGRNLAGAPYAAATLAIDAVCQPGLADQQRWVERLTGAEYVATPWVDSALRIARAGAGKGRLSGLASAVPSADRATHLLVCTADEDRVALVPLRQAGVELTARPTWDATRRLFDVRFSDVALEEPLLIAGGSAARALTRRLSTLRDFALTADSVGGAEALLEMTVEYLKTRRQFGRPLALFQALKHRCADLKALTAGAQALLADSLGRVEGRVDDAEAEGLARIAKVHACSVYARVAEEALQLHGGIGMTSEHACHLFLKRALLNEQLGRPRGRDELEIAERFLARFS
ncbi:acyl-CoA dehydrogenase [Solimonas sp. K1W22B-7]|uniref:acyl-CoA dehydrogenase family protein n=1 Tax=Solimonas sp. K1W22B-7 TaxID=2303331 RepID=UPI000E330979|nr:acyl-CoA dehydrogenase family protein [Solimonas sp. K1W22B-7]AXQ30682.1 acyl-CoA dehydrogenase [Solimonas sp. K1W22B-7]